MAKGTAAVILTILIIEAVSGYLFYTRYVQGTVVLSITDPPKAQPGRVNSMIRAFFTSISFSPRWRSIREAMETIAIMAGTLSLDHREQWI